MKAYINFFILITISKAFPQTETISLSNTVGEVAYESKDHRSNVYEVVSDRKTINNNQFQGIIIAATDYYPYGSEIPTRYFSDSSYKYGFQGQEKDEEVKGKGNSINYKYRMHDTRVGRFFAVDPLANKYPYNSTYAFSENTVVNAIELEGLEAFFIHGTMSDRTRWFNYDEKTKTASYKEHTKQLFRLTNNKTANVSFNWGFNKGVTNYGNGLLNNIDDRELAANMLALHVLKNLKEGEDITLIGHSHGGNVAIQAAAILRKKLDENDNTKNIKINIITVATPVDNTEGSRENPSTENAIDSHIHIYNELDEIQTTGANVAGGSDSKDFEREYKYKLTKNFKIPSTLVLKGLFKGVYINLHAAYKYKRIGLDAHSIDESNPEILKELIDDKKIKKQ